MVPYLILLCLLNCSVFSIGSLSLCEVKKAARLAVYDDTKIKQKKLHMHDINLIEVDLGKISTDCLINLLNVNQHEFNRLNWSFSFCKIHAVTQINMLTTFKL